MSTKEQQARWRAKNRAKNNEYMRLYMKARYKKKGTRPPLTPKQRVALADLRAFRALGGMTPAERGVRPKEVEPRSIKKGHIGREQLLVTPPKRRRKLKKK